MKILSILWSLLNRWKCVFIKRDSRRFVNDFDHIIKYTHSRKKSAMKWEFLWKKKSNLNMIETNQTAKMLNNDSKMKYLIIENSEFNEAKKKIDFSRQHDLRILTKKYQFLSSIIMSNRNWSSKDKAYIKTVVKHTAKMNKKFEFEKTISVKKKRVRSQFNFGIEFIVFSTIFLRKKREFVNFNQFLYQTSLQLQMRIPSNVKIRRYTRTRQIRRIFSNFKTIFSQNSRSFWSSSRQFKHSG